MKIPPSPTIQLPPEFVRNAPTPTWKIPPTSDRNNNIVYHKNQQPTYFKTLERGPMSVCLSPKTNSALSAKSQMTNFSFSDGNLATSTPNKRKLCDEEDNDSGIYDFEEYLRSPTPKDFNGLGNRRKEPNCGDVSRPTCVKGSEIGDNNICPGNVGDYWTVYDYDGSGVSRDHKSLLCDASEVKLRPKLKSTTPRAEPVENKKESSKLCGEMKVVTGGDMFQCKHVLCHRCIRKHVYGETNVSKPIKCPICGAKENNTNSTDSGKFKGETHIDARNEWRYSGNDLIHKNGPCHFGHRSDGNSNATCGGDRPSVRGQQKEKLTSVQNFHNMVHKFEDVDMNLRRLKQESVQTESVEMLYTRVRCDLCWENHGILKVLQEQDRLSVNHKRPENIDRFYRLSSGEIVTSYSSRIISSSVCVPCTYRSLHTGSNLALSPKGVASKACLTEIGQVVLRKAASVIGLEGQYQTDMEHEISMHTRADNYSFRRASQYLEDAIVHQEKEVFDGIRSFTMTPPDATLQIEDTGGMFSLKQKKNIDFVEIGSNDVHTLNRNSDETDIW